MKKLLFVSVFLIVFSIPAYAMMGHGMMKHKMDMDDSQSKLKCAEQWIKKAVDRHEIHIKDPKTATEASQMEMMDQMKKAYDCITGTGSEMKVTPSTKSGEEEKKKDAHRH